MVFEQNCENKTAIKGRNKHKGRFLLWKSQHFLKKLARKIDSKIKKKPTFGEKP